MDKTEFDYPEDFLDRVEDPVVLDLPPFKASSILYASCGVLMLASFLLPLMDMATRASGGYDSVIELMEWNMFSQTGLFLGLQGKLMFWLGIMVDRRGA
ncbi:MAG: hypothetical protein V3T23_03085 [Nitrososphaerales archaeon]